MRVTILTVGSRGDVEPFLALSRGLLAAGHDPVIATLAEFEPMVTGAGIPFALLPGNSRAVLAGPEGQALMAERNPFRLIERMRAVIGPALLNAHPAAEEACAGADLVVHHTMAVFGITIAERLGVPSVAAHLFPNSPTREFPMVAMPSAVPAALNRLTWRIAESLPWRAFRPLLDTRRAELGMPPLSRRPLSRWPTGAPARLYGFSPAVVPPPADWRADDHVTGYWFTEHGAYTPPQELVDFLAAGPPPVYLGFGSASGGSPEETADLLLSAARANGLRAVLNTGWAGLTATAEDALTIDDVPHWWLFPRVRAAVHHGGAGTTAAALRAGIPSVVVPFFSDQFFWGRQVAELSVGAVTATRDRVTGPELAEALRTALTRAPRARELAAELATEDGVATAVEVLESLVR